MNLYEKLCQTEPGRHAHEIGEAVYRAPSALGKECCDKLSAARAYLEKLAIEELRKSEPWVVALENKAWINGVEAERKKTGTDAKGGADG